MGKSEKKQEAKFVIWKDSFSVHDELLDRQHQRIITIINTLYDDMKQGHDADRLEKTLQTMMQYSLTHFESEQAYMQKHDFSEYDQHLLAHDKYRNTIGKLSKTFLRDHKDVSMETMDFLKKWWLDHICRMDARYRDYIAGLEPEDNA